MLDALAESFLARAVVASRDVAWRLQRDALANLEGAASLHGEGQPPSTTKGWFELWRLNLILNQLERLEVRGRDSGGLGTLLTCSEATWLELEAALPQDLREELDRRQERPSVRDGAVLRVVGQGVAALAHDAIVTVGFFSVFGLPFDLTVVAAVLAVIGYSLNDTVVAFDRIRENFRKIRKGVSEDVINTSLNQTLGRTLVTSLTTLLVLLALLFAGGEMIRGFALALTIGVLVGTYSSIYVAANVLLAMKITREDLLIPEKENPDQAMP